YCHNGERRYFDAKRRLACELSRLELGRRSERTATKEFARYFLHLIAPKVFIVQSLEHLAHLFVGGPGGNISRQLRTLQYLIIHENRAIHAQRKGESIGGTGIHADNAAFPLQPNDGVERIFF